MVDGDASKVYTKKELEVQIWDAMNPSVPAMVEVFSKSPHMLLDTIAELIRRFKAAFEYWLDRDTGDEHYYYLPRKASKAFYWCRDCKATFEAWQIAARLNEDTATFQGGCLHDLTEAIDSILEDDAAGRIATFRSFNELELQRLRLNWWLLAKDNILKEQASSLCNDMDSKDNISKVETFQKQLRDLTQSIAEYLEHFLPRRSDEIFPIAMTRKSRRIEESLILTSAKLYESWRINKYLHQSIEAIEGERLRLLAESLCSRPKNWPEAEICLQYFLQHVDNVPITVTGQNPGTQVDREYLKISPPLGSTPRPKKDRDATWVQWADEGMTPAKIRDKWNTENPQAKVSTHSQDRGLSTVKNAIKRERIRQRDENV